MYNSFSFSSISSFKTIKKGETMCAPSLNWTSKYKPLSKEDIMGEFRSSGEYHCHIDSDGNILRPSTFNMATCYGSMTSIAKVNDIHEDIIETVPGDAIEIIFHNEYDLSDFLDNQEKPKDHDYNDLFNHDKDFLNPITEVNTVVETKKEDWKPTIHNTGYMGCYNQYNNWKVKKLSPVNQNRDKYAIENSKLNWCIKTLRNVKSTDNPMRLNGIIKYIKANFFSESSLNILRKEYIDTTWRLHKEVPVHTYKV